MEELAAKWQVKEAARVFDDINKTKWEEVMRASTVALLLPPVSSPLRLSSFSRLPRLNPSIAASGQPLSFGYITSNLMVVVFFIGMFLGFEKY